MKEVSLVKIDIKWVLVDTDGAFFKESVSKGVSTWGDLDKFVKTFSNSQEAKDFCTSKDFYIAKDEKQLISDYLTERHLCFLFERQGQGYEMMIENSLVTGAKTDYEEWETLVSSEFIKNGYAIFVCQEKEMVFLVEYKKVF